MKTFATTNLRIARVKKGYTIQTLAEKLSISKQTYGKIERGYNAAGIISAHEICKVLEVEFDDVFEIREKVKG